MARRAAVNVGLVVVALVLAFSIWLQSGRIQENGGLGYDGTGYSAMVIRSFEEGSPNQRLRPLVLAINQLAYDFVFHEPRDYNESRQERDVIRTFQAMNFVWAGLLVLVLCAILDLHRVSTVHKLIFIVNVFATIAVVKMFMFYPILIDLGAYVWMSLAVYAVLRGNRALIVATTILGVLTRELALVVVLAGIHRDIRQRASLVKTAATYLPSIVLFAVMRSWVVSTSDRDAVILSAGNVIANLAYLVSPLFLLFFVYFLLTIFGGLSVLLICRSLRRGPPVNGETEWLTYAGVLIAWTAVGDLDIWRYFAYLLPVAAIMYARGFAHDDWRVILPWTVAITIFTQQPWMTLNEDSYFTELFPLYSPFYGRPDPPTFVFWAVWAFRFVVVAAMTAAIWIMQRERTGQRAATANASSPMGVTAGVAAHVE